MRALTFSGESRSVPLVKVVVGPFGSTSCNDDRSWEAVEVKVKRGAFPATTAKREELQMLIKSSHLL